MGKQIEFLAQVVKVGTLVDGGIRVTLDLPEQGRKVMEPLAKCQQQGILLEIKAEKK